MSDANRVGTLSRRRSATAAIALFLGTAAVVIWQNSRLAVLWDLSYILENSWRISLGHVPYRDFPFPYAPGTFLVQALLIRLTGRAFFHHVIYCAIVGGAATVLTWRILLKLLSDTTPASKLVAFLLAMPLTVLGIYGVFPHPFYDPDCTFCVLCCVFLLLRLEGRDFPPTGGFLSGLACVVPLFVKQNTGLAFLIAVTGAATLLLVIAVVRRDAAGGYAIFLAGIAAGFGIGLAVLLPTAGLRNYARWTIEFAAARRLPHLSEMFTPYNNPALLLWLAAFAAGIFLLYWNRNARRERWWAYAAVALMSAPFLWAVAYLLFVDDDASERAERLLAVWPVLLMVSLALAIWSLRRGLTLRRLLPLILIATIQGAFLSQQLWGSTYAVWPLLVILFACVLAELSQFAKPTGEKRSREIEWFAGLAAACLLVAGGFYVASHERLDYADVSSGDLAHSTLRPLAGLSMRGPWIPDFEELVRFSDRAIPRDEGLLMIPGEDLFYYTTGRRPQFPVLMFDHTVNPYSPEQIVELSRARNICWLVVKKHLQLNGDPVEDRGRLLDLLRGDFAPVQHLANYDIYRRSSPAACARDSDLPSVRN